MREIDIHSLLDRLLDPVSRCLTVEQMRQCRIGFDELPGKCTEGALTPEEASEYDMYLNASTFIGILQAKASRMLETSSSAWL